MIDTFSLFEEVSLFLFSNRPTIFTLLFLTAFYGINYISITYIRIIKLFREASKWFLNINVVDF